LDKRASILDLSVDFQDLERFSVLDRYAIFHGRGQADGTQPTADASRPSPKRYVTAVPMSENLPDMNNNQAYENSLVYKERTKKLHDDKIKNCIFNVGDQVLLFNSRLKIFSGKLKSRWSGPFTISEIYPYGTAKLIHPDGCNFKVNCHRLKHYYGGDPPPLEIPNVTTFPKDN
nr:reverse transcriptase domain-containing protein [Tanacetum cinerariifolium]